MDIDDPQFPHIVVIGRPHLIVDQSGLHRREPKEIVGTAPVAEVIIDATTPTPLLLLNIAQTRHVTIVIVAPHQRDVVGHFQTFLVDLQHLLIRNEDLHLLRWVTDIFPQQVLLVVDDLLQGIELLLHGLHTLHRAIVDTAHADGKHVTALGAFDLFESLNPIVLYGLFVRDIVEPSTLGNIPFIDIITQKRLTMTGAHDDATAIGHGFVAGDLEECRCSRMHAGPDSIGTQTEQQLEDLLISLRPYRSELRLLEIAIAPGAQRPVLIIEEDATVFDRSSLQCREVIVDCEFVLMSWHHIAPPDPWTYTCHTREF